MLVFPTGFQTELLKEPNVDINFVLTNAYPHVQHSLISYGLQLKTVSETIVGMAHCKPLYIFPMWTRLFLHDSL